MDNGQWTVDSVVILVSGRERGGMTRKTLERRFPIGAEVLPESGVHFCVWAPRRKKVAVVIEGGPGHKRRDHPTADLYALPIDVCNHHSGSDYGRLC